MDWRFDDMVTFLDVLETGSITLSAARLNLSKSVVSKRISDLEQALGVALFQRSPRKLTPTESAGDFADRIRPLIRDIIDAADTVSERQSGLKGRLRIAAPMSFGTMYLSRIIADFALAHPDLQIAADFDDRMTDIVQSGFDVGIRIGALKDSSLIAKKLCTDPRVICCSPHYAAARGLPKTLEDLPNFDCLDYANVHAGQIWQFDNPAGKGPPVSVGMHSRIVANNGEAMRDMAIAGLGLVLLPMFICAEALRDGRLIPVRLDAKPSAYTIHAVYPPTRHLPAKVRAFVDHLARHITDPPLWRLASEGAPSGVSRDA
ncbi:LysR family transcriptional regulator [Pararhizobium sp.]|uniref:LysR family transcriptional regulator n=1 Tax=Pararhizobium sp. TaxID=1977563 RepID=UPI0027262B60|nr:LysR family transcriptional regulator [Pararhizobium sp.]MDO9415048.1 LysR family transcriptional regulator [Pararhizobium sp.]